jgi:2'-5' RNA ligase
VAGDRCLGLIALLPPERVAREIEAIEQYFARTYGSRHALKSPPHLTLQPPFRWPVAQWSPLEERVQQFARGHPPLALQLSGFGAFAPRVIYVAVAKTPKLEALHRALVASLSDPLGISDPKAKKRPFNPHITVAHRDLSERAFHQAWPAFRQREWRERFTVSQLTLLAHDGQQWQVSREFPLQGAEEPTRSGA